MSEKKECRYIILGYDLGDYVFRVLEEKLAIEMIFFNSQAELDKKEKISSILAQLVYAEMKEGEEQGHPNGTIGYFFLGDSIPHYSADEIEEMYPVFLEKIPATAMSDLDS